MALKLKTETVGLGNLLGAGGRESHKTARRRASPASMRCDAASASSSSWLSARHAPRAPSFGSLKPRPFLCRCCCFFARRKPASSCCTKGPADSSSSSLSRRSYSRRWYDPLRRRRLQEAAPDIARHWVVADQPLASQGEVMEIKNLEKPCIALKKNCFSNM